MQSNKEQAIFDYITGGSLQESKNKFPDISFDMIQNYQAVTKGIITTTNNKASITLYVLGYKAASVIIPLIHGETDQTFWDLHQLIINNKNINSEHIRLLFVTFNKKAKVTEYVSGSDITIKNQSIYYKGIKQSGKLVDQILKAIKNKKRASHLIKFMNKLMSNPSYHIHTRLFDFLEHNDIEIDKDGDFIAFKNINSNFTDIYTGLIDNSVGKFVSMDRNLVDDNDRNTCSAGLHVCAKSYLKSYSRSNGHTVKVKVDPKNVVSIPVDYNNAKMRTCGYLVLEKTTKNGE